MALSPRIICFRLLLALLLPLSLFSLQGCSREAREPMRVGTVLWPGHEPLFLARQLGFLDERQIRLVEYSTLTEELRAFRNGTLEAIGITLDMAIVLKQHGFDPRVVLVLDYSEGADAIIARQEVHGLQDLRGRRVGVEDSGVSLFVLGRALEQAGMKPADLQLVHLPVDQQLRAFLEGRVDVVVTTEPFASQLLAAGARKVFDSSQIPGEIMDVLAVRGNYLAGHEEQLHHLVEAWFAALAYLETHPEDAIARMSPRLGMSQEELSVALRGMQFPGLEENQTLLAGPQPGLTDAAGQVQQQLLDLGMLQRPVELETLPDPHVIEGAR